MQIKSFYILIKEILNKYLLFYWIYFVLFSVYCCLLRYILHLIAKCFLRYIKYFSCALLTEFFGGYMNGLNS